MKRVCTPSICRKGNVTMNGTALNFHYDFLTSLVLTDPEFFTKKVPYMKAAGVRTVWLDNYIYGEWQNTPEEAFRAKAMLEAEGFEVQAICVPLGHGSNALNGDEADPTLPPTGRTVWAPTATAKAPPPAWTRWSLTTTARP